MKHISLDLVRVTEAAAISASAYIGSGNKLEADRVATEAMRDRLNRMDFFGMVAIGEGKKDESYGLFKGDKVGNYHLAFPVGNPDNYPNYDIGLDPIDGTTPTVNAGPEAMSIIAVANAGCMFDTEEHYMLKLAYGPHIASKFGSFSDRPNLNEPIDLILEDVASALKKPVNKLTVCILNRPRHQEYIQSMRNHGVRIKLIQDCDVSAAIATCLPDSNIDIQFGIGGAPEAVITAAAMKCLGGHFQAQIWKDGVLHGPIMRDQDLVRGECAFAATGITDGSMLNGVRWDSKGPITNSVFMRSESGTVRWLTTNHGN